MAAPSRVSDQVWALLDPGARRPPRARRLTIAVAAFVAGLILCWYLVSVSGLAWPRLSVDAGWSGEGSAVDLTVSQTVVVSNDGWTSAAVTGVASPIAAMLVTGVDGLPATVRSGGQATITVHYRVTDCSAFADQPGPELTTSPMPAPMSVQVTRWWGTISVPLGEVPQTLAAEVCRQAGRHR